MKPVLFITLPNVTLFMKKKRDALALPYGASILTAGIKEAGLQLDYFDFNLALNRIRSADITSHDTIERLTQVEKFLDHYYLQDDPILTSWVNELCSMVEKKDYHTICLSMDRREYAALSSKAAYCFAILVAKALKLKFNRPILMGGQYAFKSLGDSFLHGITQSINPFPIDIETRGSLILELGKILVELQNGLSMFDLAGSKRLEQFESFQSSANLVPNYKINNYDDLVVSRSEYLPDEVIEILPEKYKFLADIAPFFIAPYKFSLGCPFTCAFCIDGLDMKYSQHRAEQVVNVLSKLGADGISDFNFYNNNINLNRDYLARFEQLMLESNIKIRFSDSANLQNTSDEFFGKISRMGCIRLWYGTESVSERQLGFIHKKLNKEKIIRGLSNAHNFGIWNSCNFIYNFPHETQDEFNSMLSFIQESEFIDAFETNEFRLMDNTAFQKFPEKYGLALRYSSDTKKVFAFDEVGGLNWEQKVLLGKEKRDAVRKIKTKMYRYLSVNDYVVFALRKSGLLKSDIREVLCLYSDFIYNNSLRKKFSEDHLHTLPAYIFDTRPATKIYGQDVQSTVSAPIL